MPPYSYSVSPFRSAVIAMAAAWWLAEPISRYLPGIGLVAASQPRARATVRSFRPVRTASGHPDAGECRCGFPGTALLSPSSRRVYPNALRSLKDGLGTDVPLATLDEPGTAER